MTPSPANDDLQKRASGPAQFVDETPGSTKPLNTPAGLGNETPQELNTLTHAELSPVEERQAAAALAFLDEVRSEQKSAALPESIGRYSIVRSIGRGGFAEVFLAEDEELDRRVALKIPLFNTATNEAGRQRFEREAKLAASLGHPQIVPVYEYADLGAIRFIAFGWCNGPNLSEWLAEHGPVDFNTAAKMVASLADAVQHAHQRGIVHRDLKPSNVLVDSSEASAEQPIWERLRITDFGLARSFDTQDVTLTQDGELVGTPAYMAPEQALGEEQTGAAADVWALGMMLFELLTGKLPFRKSDALATIRAICDDPVPKARMLCREIPRSLEAITELCLQKESSRRYDSAHELAEDLRRWCNDEPVKAKSPAALAKFGLWVRRNPLLAGSIALAMVSLSVGLAIALWQRNEAIANLKEAQTQTVRADGNLETAQGLIRSIVELEKKLRSQSQLSKERTALVEQAAAFQIELIEDEERTPQIRYETALSLRELSFLLLQLGEYDASFTNAKYVVSLLEGLEETPPKGVTAGAIYGLKVQQRIRMGAALGVLGKLDDAIAIYEANRLDEPPADMNAFDRAMVLSENLRAKGMTVQRKGDIVAATEALQMAVELIKDVDAGDSEQRQWELALNQCRLLLTLGACQTFTGDSAEAEVSFLASVAALERMKTIFPDHQEVAANEGLVHVQMGTLYEQQKNWPAAIKSFRICRDTYLKIFNQNRKIMNPGNMYLLSSLSLTRCLKGAGKAEESEEVAKTTVEEVTSFPDNLQQNAAFKDNFGFIKEFAGSDEN